jgi:hypothetical protein
MSALSPADFGGRNFLIDSDFLRPQNLFHGTGQATDLPRLRGVSDSSAATRGQRAAHVPVLGLRRSGPPEVSRRYGLACR